jgi:hypothetical protein
VVPVGVAHAAETCSGSNHGINISKYLFCKFGKHETIDAIIQGFADRSEVNEG